MAAVQSIWKMAFRNLSSQNTTTILTVAAIAVCVMTFVSIFSILDGLQLTVQGVLQKQYRKLVVVITSSGADNFLESSFPRDLAGEYRALPEAFRLSDEVVAEFLYEGVEIDVVGADIEDLEEVSPFQSLEGREIQGPGECMVGTTLARNLDIGRNEAITISKGDRGLDLTVVGVFTINTSMDAQLLVDREHLATFVPRFTSNSSVMRIRLKSTEDAKGIVDYTEVNHPELDVREATQVGKFFEKSIINIARLLSTIVVFVIILMVLGIYNSMNMVVSERVWEIGVIRAIGARRSFILRLFVVESAMLALLGGLFGVALGIAMSHGITSFFAVLVPGSTSIAPLTKVATVGWGILAALSIGLLGGMFPANRASKLIISEALSEG